MGFSGCHILLSPLKLKKSLQPSPSIYGWKIPTHIPELTSRELLTAVQSYPGLSHGTPNSSWSPSSSAAAVKRLLRLWLFPMASFGMPSCPHGQSGIRGVSRSSLGEELWVPGATGGFVPSLGIRIIPAAPEQPSAKAELGLMEVEEVPPQKCGREMPKEHRTPLLCFGAKPYGSVALLPQSLPFQPIFLICAALIPSKPWRPQEQELGEVRECRELIINEAHKLPCW